MAKADSGKNGTAGGLYYKERGGTVSQDNSLESVRKNNKKNKRKNTALSLAVLGAVLVVGAFLCYTKLFKIQKLKIDGECPYTQQEMLEGMEIAFGDTLYGKSEKEIKQNVKYNLAYIDSVDISRIWPSTLKVKVNKANPTFYISIEENMYVLSQSLRVLSKTDNIEDIELKKLVPVNMGGIKSCIEGQYIDGDNDSEELLKELYELLTKYDIFNHITNIDLTDRFDIKLSYDTKFLVKLGDKVNLERKIQFMLTIIEEKNKDGGSGIVDVSDDEVKEGTFESFT